MKPYDNPILFFVFACLMLLNTSATAASSPQLITTQYGKVQGFLQNDCEQYLGIPYAMPPLDNTAFKHPLPPTPWDTVLIARHGKANAIQERSRFSATYLDMDCLYLNIYKPVFSSKKKKKMPVFIWFHGGSFSTGGTGANPDGTMRFDMSYFAKETGCIVVTVNYRLNLYGFLYLSWLDKSFEPNCGLYDQLLAMQFVKDNISAFGGDPNNITLFGQSAGASCVLAMLGIEEAQSLFRRAILMSPCVDHFLTPQEAQARASRYLKYFAINRKNASRLFSVSPSMVQYVNRTFTLSYAVSGETRCAFSPVIDGVLIKDQPAILAANSTKPILIGYTSEESKLFAQKVPKTLLPAIAHSMNLFVPQKEADDPRPYSERMLECLSHRMFFAPIDTFYAHYKGKKWKYIYTYTTPQMQEQDLGCCHSYELPVLFGQDNAICHREDSATLQTGQGMRKIWSSFAHTGKLNSKEVIVF